MRATFAITLTHHMPEDLWTATASNRATKQILGGMFTSAEAALNACWLTTDERISLPGIATRAQVQELLNARLGIEDATAVDDASIYLAAQGDPANDAVTAVITEVSA